MAEHFGFFDAVQDVNGAYDREYNAEQFTIPFNVLVTNGVVRNAYEQLEVITNGSNMISTIKKGVAFINGHHYFNDATVELTHDIEVLGLKRIDRVVIRLDNNPDSRHVRAFIRKGTPSVNPVPPTLTRNANVYEISLAQVVIVGGQGFINLTSDERGSVNFCPWAGSNILPSFDDNMLAQHVNNGTIHVTQTEKNNLHKHHFYGQIDTRSINFESKRPFEVRAYLASISPELGSFKVFADGFALGIPYATVGTFGTLENIVSWADSTGGRITQVFKTHERTYQRYSTVDESMWGVWVVVSSVVVDVEELFTSVGSGKQAVANAITEKGITTAPNAEFATMAANIRQINTGKKFASGTIATTGFAPDVKLTVNGLAFRPRLIIAYSNEWDRYILYDDYNPTNYYITGASGQDTAGMNISKTTYVNSKSYATVTDSSFSLHIFGTAVTYNWMAFE